MSNGPTEAINGLIKKVKRVGHGYRNFDNYRLRLLLHCGTDWHTPTATPIRPESTSSAVTRGVEMAVGVCQSVPQCRSRRSR